MTTRNKGRKKQFVALLWLFSILWVLLGSHKVLAQGSVGVTVTISGTSTAATASIGGTATFSASASATPTPDKEWSVNGDPTYSWSGTPATFDPSDKAETTGSVTESSPGTYPIAVTCTVTYPVIKTDPGQPDNGDTATISGTNKPAATATVYFIGGPITGTNDIHYYCDPAETSDWGHLSAATGQPAGTTYSWSITGNAQLVQDTAYPSPADATYAGKHPGSSAVGDVTATVTYTLNGVSVASPPFPITVHAPKTFVLLSKTAVQKLIPPDPGAYGFDGQSVTFRITDGLGLPITGANWNEGWDDPQGGGVPGLQGGGALDGNGTNTDTLDQFAYPNYSSTPPNNTTTGDKIFGPLTHNYSVSDEKGTGGNQLGCKVQTYTNIYYYTYGITGNGY